MRIVTAALLLGLAFASLGIGPARAGDSVQIAIVDFDRVLISTDKGKAAREELERKMNEAKTTLNQMGDDFKKADKVFKEHVDSHAVKDEVLEMERVDLLERQNNIQTKQKALEAKLKATQNQLFGPLIQEIGALVQAIGKEQHFSLILHRAAPSLIYFEESLDITDLIIERFNQKG